MEKYPLVQWSIWKAFWNGLASQTSILKFCLSNSDQNYWPFESLSVRKRKSKICLLSVCIEFCFVIIIFCRSNWECLRQREQGELGSCQMLPRKSDTGTNANVPCRMLPRDSNCDWVWLPEAKNLKQKDLHVPGIRAGTICPLLKTADARHCFS